VAQCSGRRPDVIERWLVAIRDHPQRPPALQRHVLTCLGLRMDWSTGRGFASAEQLAADADAEERTVRRATAWARSEPAGLLLRTRRGHRLGNGQSVSSEWQLTLPVDKSSQPDTGDLLRSQPDNGAASTGQRGRLNRTAAHPHQESSTSRSSPSPRASTAAGTIRGAFPGATDDEIETITQTIKTRHQPRNLTAYIAALAANGTLRLPCDQDGPDKHSEACRKGDGGACSQDWCTCRCHLNRTAQVTP
jgi:hypothetical protein